VNERSMLSSSPPKIHEPLAVGVSPRPTDHRQHQELRNTRRELEACFLTVFALPPPA
jgi:hypothetical protein